MWPVSRSAPSGRPISSSARSSPATKPRPPGAERPALILNYGLKYDDYKRIVETVPTIRKVLPVREIRKQIRRDSYTLDGRLVGHHPGLCRVQPAAHGAAAGS